MCSFLALVLGDGVFSLALIAPDTVIMVIRLRYHKSSHLPPDIARGDPLAVAVSIASLGGEFVLERTGAAAALQSTQLSSRVNCSLEVCKIPTVIGDVPSLIVRSVREVALGDELLLPFYEEHLGT
jgi:hypothetical protein